MHHLPPTGVFRRAVFIVSVNASRLDRLAWRPATNRNGLSLGTGLLGGLALGRTVSSLVFGGPVRDSAVFIGVAATLAIVALAACVIPALRASRVDPIVALRYE